MACGWWATVGNLYLYLDGIDVTVLGLVGGAPGGETPRVADSSAAGDRSVEVDVTVLGLVDLSNLKVS